MTMKAVHFHEFGDADVLRLEEVPVPTPAPGQVLVRVGACALNYLDIWSRRGQPRPTSHLPHIPGCDVAGEVAELGPGVTGVTAGDRVMINPGLSCGRCPACLSGRDNLCRHYGVLGVATPGGYAEYVVVPAANLVPMPADLDFVDAAAIPLVFITAWHMLDRAQLAMGETVLVMGASGGVGTAAVQLARLRGARVLAVAGGSEKASRVKALGADAVIDHKTEDISQRVKELTGGSGADVVVESVGEAVWNTAMRCMGRRARLVTCGATSGPRVQVDLRHLFAKHQTMVGTYMGSKADLWAMLPYIEDGQIKAVVDRSLPLSEAAQAHTIVENRAHVGKVVLVP